MSNCGAGITRNTKSAALTGNQRNSGITKNTRSSSILQSRQSSTTSSTNPHAAVSRTCYPPQVAGFLLYQNSQFFRTQTLDKIKVGAGL